MIQTIPSGVDITVQTKLCKKCGITFPHTSEFFDRNKMLKTGLKRHCKPCAYLYSIKGDYARNRDWKHVDDYQSTVTLLKRRHNPYASLKGYAPDTGVVQCPKRNVLRESLLLSEFKGHIDRWKKETRHWSSLVRKLTHPSYLRIIALAGQIPYREAERILLIELAEDPRHWFTALEAITGEDPVRMEYDFDQSVEAWLDWGELRGII